jgi:hypothetical protein
MRKAYTIPGDLMERFVALGDDLEQRWTILEMLNKDQEEAVFDLYRKLCEEGYKEEAAIVSEMYNAYYPHKRIPV